MYLCRKTTLAFLALVSLIFLFSDSAQARRGKTTFNKMTIEDVDLSGKTVLIRVDFNVPLKDGVITDDTRIRAALPAIQYALEQGAKIVLTSHLDRPKGEVVPELSLTPIARRLSELLGIDVGMAPDCIGNEVESMVSDLKEGKILLLENVRFHSEETKNGPAFAKSLASLANIFVNDAFSHGSRDIAEFIASLDAIKIIGGGDTAFCIESFGFVDSFSHISTGGGVSLEYLESKLSPGVAIINTQAN